MKDILRPTVDETGQIPASKPASPASVSSSRPNGSPASTGDSKLMYRFSNKVMRVADMGGYSLALLIAVLSPWLASSESFGSVLSLRISVKNLLIEVALLFIWRFIFWLTGLHTTRRVASKVGLLLRIPIAMTLATLPVAASLLFSSMGRESILSISLRFWILGLLFMVLARAIVYTFHDAVRPAFRMKRNVIVVGTGPRARTMTEQLLAHPYVDYAICGFVDTEQLDDCHGMAPFLGDLSDLEEIVMRNPVDEVLIALPLKSSFSDVENIIAMCGHAGVKTLYSVDLFHSDIAKTKHVDENTGVHVMEMVHSDSRLVLKDILDRTAALIGIVLLAPVVAAIALSIKLTSKGPVFFVQERWGKNKRTFRMYKFRSMVVDAEARMAALEKLNEFDGPMFKMKRDPRVTRVGEFLRRTSLDELPQLLNVLKGDMSLVGPRPLPNRDVALFSEPWLMRRFSVKPGITGLWQVSGRSGTDFDGMIRLDLHYIDRWNLPLDMKILTKTINVVLRGDGAY